MAKTDPDLLAIQAWTEREFENDRQTSIEWEELAPVVRSTIHLPPI